MVVTMRNMASTPWMSRQLSLVLLVSLIIGPLATLCAEDGNVLHFIDPLIGSTNGGNVFSGATRPYGLAKAVADVDGQNTGGFSTDGSNIVGFSAVHDSGTGGNPSLGNFPLFPQLCPDDDVNNCNFRIGDRAIHYVADSVVATPGQFAVELESGIKASMTSSERAALFRFAFPSGNGNNTQHPLVLLDLTDLWKSRQNATISVDAKTARMKGNGTFLPSFGAGSYVMHFCVDFFGGDVFDDGVWVNNRAGTEPKDLYATRGFNLFYLEAGGWARFTGLVDNTLTARVGISFISADQACQSAETEIPSPLDDFDRLVQEAKDAWKEKLSPLSINAGGVSDELQTSCRSDSASISVLALLLFCHRYRCFEGISRRRGLANSRYYSLEWHIPNHDFAAELHW
jgi:putative alpha-1,2-mannosidase